VDKRVPLFILASVVLLPAAAMAAQTQNNEQNSNTQQQSSQQHSEKSDQSSNNQTGDNNENNKSEDAGEGKESRQQKDLVGRAQDENLISAQKASQILSSSLIGMTVRTKSQSIGSVKTLILNKDYKVVGFVVDMSGITGLIQKSLGIAWQAVQNVDLDKGVILVNVNKDNLQDIRSFTTQKELQEESRSQDWESQ